MIGYPELIVILILVLLLFGADKLPELAHSLGKSVKEFKNAQMETESKVILGNKDDDSKVYRLATEMGINVKDKTIEQINEEIRAKIRLQTEK